MKDKLWLLFILITIVTWGIWGAFSDLQMDRDGIPETVVYILWAASWMSACVGYCFSGSICRSGFPAGACLSMKAAFSVAAFNTVSAASTEYSAMEEKPYTPPLYTRAEIPETSERVFPTTSPFSKTALRLRLFCPRSSVCAPVANNAFLAVRISCSIFLFLSFADFIQVIRCSLIDHIVQPIRI